MALPVAPASISLGQIQTEFGGSNPISISEYVAKVSKTTAAGQNVAFSDFYGLSNVAPSSAYITISAFNIFQTSTAKGSLEINGSILAIINGGSGIYRGDWLTDITGMVPSEWEVKATKTGAAITGIQDGLWYSLGSARSWKLSNSTTTLKTALVTAVIRKVGTTTPVGVINFDLEAVEEGG